MSDCQAKAVLFWPTAGWPFVHSVVSRWGGRERWLKHRKRGRDTNQTTDRPFNQQANNHLHVFLMPRVFVKCYFNVLIKKQKHFCIFIICSVLFFLRFVFFSGVVKFNLSLDWFYGFYVNSFLKSIKPTLYIYIEYICMNVDFYEFICT